MSTIGVTVSRSKKKKIYRSLKPRQTDDDEDFDLQSDGTTQVLGYGFGNRETRFVEF